MPKRIVILTGGGDVPGLNAVIKQVTYRGLGMDFEVLGLRRGWEGLTHLNLDDPDSRSRYVLPLNQLNTRTIDRSGGTFLHSSRTNPTKMKSVPPHLEGQTFPSRDLTKDGKTSTVFDVTSSVLKNLERLGADYVVAIGGDDTLSYARRLHDEGVKVIAIPKTMDNDVRNTEYCVGFSTAITRAESAIQRQRTTVGSHERIGIFRIFGRDAGYTALYTAYVTNIRCIIPEYKPDLEQVIKVLIEESQLKVQAGARQAGEAGEIMREVVGSVQGVTTIMAEISSASREQSEGIEQVNQAVAEMDGVVQQNASLVEEAAAAAGSLQEQATRLSDAVAVFKIGPGEVIDMQDKELALREPDARMALATYARKRWVAAHLSSCLIAAYAAIRWLQRVASALANLAMVL